jgi:hypothetical protein
VRLALAATLILLVPRQAGALQYTGKTPEKGASEIVGKVIAADGKSAARGVRVLAYHLSSERTFASEPANSKGEFEIGGLPFGYYDLAVEAPDGLFVANRVLNVAPGSKAAVVFTLTPYRGSTAQAARVWPDGDRPADGQARFTEKARGRAFWRSPRGVAVLAAAGSVALLAIASSSDEVDSTPVVP